MSQPIRKTVVATPKQPQGKPVKAPQVTSQRICNYGTPLKGHR